MPGNSGAGCDEIRSGVIKKAKTGLAKPLSMLFRASLDTQLPLEEPYETEICPIIKPNKSKHDPSSYRPIALCSQIVKIMERVIIDNITAHLEKNGLTDNAQFGFVKGKSAVQQLIRYVHYIVNNVEDGRVDAIYLDFAKAFDVVNHSILIKKLKVMFHIADKVLVWISYFLQSRVQSVRVGSQKSRKERIWSSVIQGSVLGPVLFGLLIFDLQTHKTIIEQNLPKQPNPNEHVKEPEVSKYADDSKCYLAIDPSRRKIDEQTLQRKLYSIFDWAKVNKMFFNRDKFAHLTFNTISPKAEQTLKLLDHLPFAEALLANYTTDNGIIIQKSDQEKDLGTIITSDLKWNTNLFYLRKKTWTKIHMIFHTFHTRDVQTMTILWNSLCLPVLLYNTALMGNLLAKEERILENIQRKFTKNMAFSDNNLEYHQRLAEAGIKSVQRRREQIMLLHLGSEIRDKRLGEIGIRITSQNNRTGIRIETENFDPRKTSSVTDKSFSARATQLFNSLPPEIKLQVFSKPKYNSAVKALCGSLNDFPFIIPYRENSIIHQLKIRK